MLWNRKHLLGIEELSAAEIRHILELGTSFKKVLGRRVKKVPALRGKTVVNLFIEPSTRTRVAFEMAAKNLSADVVTINTTASSMTKGETLRDTAENIAALQADVLILRHSSAGSALYLSRILDIPVINAGDGAHEHPTQALLDVFTMEEKLGSVKGKTVAIVGDILSSRVARSNIWALTKLGAKVVLVGPTTLVPREFESMGAEVCNNLREGVSRADVVMLLRIQLERQASRNFPSLGEYTALFGLNQDRLSWLRKDAIIMHPGPVNRGVEIDTAVADGPRSVILDQVTNGIAVRMAVLHLCASVPT
jgi:aspartate carbamoyltransferase catalytic subunit